MVKDKCPSAEMVKQLEKSQATLDFNQKRFMELLEKLEQKVDDIHKFIFQWEMAKNYVTRDVFNLTIKDFEQRIEDKDKQIKELKSNQSRIAWIVITAVLLAVIGLVIVPKI